MFRIFYNKKAKKKKNQTNTKKSKLVFHERRRGQLFLFSLPRSLEEYLEAWGLCARGESPASDLPPLECSLSISQVEVWAGGQVDTGQTLFYPPTYSFPLVWMGVVGIHPSQLTV